MPELTSEHLDALIEKGMLLHRIGRTDGALGCFATGSDLLSMIAARGRKEPRRARWTARGARDSNKGGSDPLKRS
jgi:hypothetical protein